MCVAPADASAEQLSALSAHLSPSLAQSSPMCVVPADDSAENLSALSALAQRLLRVDCFYNCVGGLLGYQLLSLRTVLGNAGGAPDGADSSGDESANGASEAPTYHMPRGLDLASPWQQGAAVKAVATGLQALPHMAEIYPLGGAIGAQILGFRTWMLTAQGLCKEPKTKTAFGNWFFFLAYGHCRPSRTWPRSTPWEVRSGPRFLGLGLGCSPHKGSAKTRDLRMRFWVFVLLLGPWPLQALPHMAEISSLGDAMGSRLGCWLCPHDLTGSEFAD